MYKKYTKNNLDKVESKLKATFIKFIEKTGTMPWSSGVIRNAFSNPSKNAKGEFYKNCNAWITYMYRVLNNWDSDTFLTCHEINKRGGRIKKGESACIVIKPYDKYFDENGKKIKWQEAKRLIDAGKEVTTAFGGVVGHSVFNLAQTTLEYEHLTVLDANNITTEKSADDIIKGYANCPKIIHEAVLSMGDGYYAPSADEVHLYPPAGYKSISLYYATLFHELVHSTEHKTRLNITSGSFGSKNYARNELRAEIGASMLMAMTNLDEVTEHNGAYIKSWITKLTNIDNFESTLSTAFSMARKAVDYILGITDTKAEVA